MSHFGGNLTRQGIARVIQEAQSHHAVARTGRRTEPETVHGSINLPDT